MNDSQDIVTDSVLDGRLRLRQLRHGHRAGTDAILLAASTRLEPGDHVVDVGAGVGTVGLALALRAKDLTVRLLDVDPEMAALASDNCRLNGLELRVSVAQADLFDPDARRAAGLGEESASLVVTNPPFFLAEEGRESPYPAKARAHGLGRKRHHADWLRASLALLAPKGRLHAIHRPEALPALLAATEGRLGAVKIVPVHARAGGPAIRILLFGIKGSRAPMGIGPALVLHDADGRFTSEAEALHRGAAWAG